MNKRTLDLVIFGTCTVWGLIVLPRMATGLWSTTAESAIIWAGGLLRLLFLAIAAIAAVRCVRALDPSNPARTSQAFLAGGFTVYLIAQATLFGLTLASNGSPPFPSVADLGYLASMLLLIAGVALGIRAWLALGLFPGGGSKAATAAVAAAVPLIAGTLLTVRSLASADLPELELAADIAYPVFDSMLLVLTVAMLRLTMLLGKGAVGAVWRSLLLGFLVMTVGDVVYSFFAGFNLAVLDPLLDLLYTVAYGLYARGTLLQLKLVR
jgi:hypothetical protein